MMINYLGWYIYLLIRTYNLAKGTSSMIKIRISYRTDEEFKRVLDDLKSFEVVRVRNEKSKGIYKNRWVELRYIG